MKKLIQVLRDRRGESMVEILVSAAVFMLLLGALNGAVGFEPTAQGGAAPGGRGGSPESGGGGNARRRRRCGL